ncbi:hypothetical protein [Lysinibacillus sp. fls2-241-R2A-57]|uniref:hypothetical protein n=1 Tax=Lysinibacillus sp. fls2-241-R2A-57 TaxID=3040292 RepID=UPI0025560EAC|nr:hypothetical protein [Lysinibacillus sp. fls2-241-R2A-57]
MLKTNVKVSMCNSFLIIMTDLSKILVLQSANVFCAKAKRQQQNVFCAKAKRQQQRLESSILRGRLDMGNEYRYS